MSKRGVFGGEVFSLLFVKKSARRKICAAPLRPPPKEKPPRKNIPPPEGGGFCRRSFFAPAACLTLGGTFFEGAGFFPQNGGSSALSSLPQNISSSSKGEFPEPPRKFWNPYQITWPVRFSFWKIGPQEISFLVFAREVIHMFFKGKNWRRLLHRK